MRKLIREVAPRTVILTYDDGLNDATLPISRYLKQQEIAATFFIIVGRSRDAIYRLSELQSSGHIVGNHSYTHDVMPKLSPDRICDDFTAAHQWLRFYMDPSKRFLRAPGGAWSERCDLALSDSVIFDSYHGPIHWTVGCGDEADFRCWADGVSMEECAERYFAKIEQKNGGVILLHDFDARSETLAKILVPKLKSAGYQFSNLDSLI